MQTKLPIPAHRRQRGSALITVLLFTAMLLVLAASVMQWSVTEARLNARNSALLEARNAAEAVAEYGCYQVVRAFSTRMNPTFEATGITPVAFPSSLASTFFAGSRVTASSIELRAGSVVQVPSSAMYYIDPRDPNNAFDPLAGRYVLRRDVTVLAKVTVTPNGGGAPVSAYVQEKVSVRGAPLFAYAIFYSGNDLEVNPLPQMDIYGPVHVNGNLYIGTVGTAATTFHGPVTASGHVFHAWRGTTSTAKEGGSTMSNTTAVNFSTEQTGVTVVNMLSGGVWKDSTMGASSGVSGYDALNALVTPARNAAFLTYASTTWKGYLQTSAMGITAYNPMGYSEQVAVDGSGNPILATSDLADNGATVSQGTGYGHGYGPHALIEPSGINNPTPGAPTYTPFTTPTTFATAKASIEEQKFANKAALYITVKVTDSGVVTTADAAPTIKMYADPNSGTTLAAAAKGPNLGMPLHTTFPSDVFQFIPYTVSSTNVTKGLYDQHQAVGVNLLQINMAALKVALTNMTTSSAAVATSDFRKADGTKWGLGTTNGYDKYTVGSGGWNGGIYIDVYTTGTTITKHTAVLVSNGYTASGSSMVPSGTSAPNGIFGLTIATNAPIYILGHYNADGTISTAAATNSAMYPDDGNTGAPGDPSAEAPCALAGDAITVLSPNYFGTGATTRLAPSGASTNASTTNAYKSKSTMKPTASGSSEIAAAFISGSNETSPTATGTQQYSGGVHNMPRFLEDWSPSSTYTVAIRGSLVNMYNNRVATGAWSISYYDPPVRQWGFNQLFANGNFPPICPQVISYRRVDFTYITNASAYNTAVSGL